MNYSEYYQYIDEASINRELICGICTSPLLNPVCTPCDHLFCRDCITRSINRGDRTCPLCRSQVLSTQKLESVNRAINNMVNCLPVVCKLCGQSGIQRDQFCRHIENVCPKVNVSCPAKDISCPWTGLREKLNTHKRTCTFLPFQSIIKQLLEKSKLLENRINQLDAELKRKDVQLKQSIDNLNSK